MDLGSCNFCADFLSRYKFFVIRAHGIFFALRMTIAGVYQYYVRGSMTSE